jgi:Ala-tRNA(Pro) deacylase
MDNSDLPTPPEALLAVFDKLGITYTKYDHAPVFTVAESEHLYTVIPGLHCRNLFLRDKKKAMFLVVVADHTPVDIKQLEEKLGCGRLSFGSAERLWENLGVRPGSVCPFSVINDTNHAVQVVLDAAMMQSDLVCYHPMINSMTVSLTPKDLLRFFEHTGHEPVRIDL